MNKSIVLDTNILLRIVFGVKAAELLDKYEATVDFFTTDICYQELDKYAFKIGEAKEIPRDHTELTIETVYNIVRPLDATVYEHNEEDAKERIGARDMDDWHLVALALALNCPIWTEDQDFFGTGLATWNSKNVEIYFRR